MGTLLSGFGKFRLAILHFTFNRRVLARMLCLLLLSCIASIARGQGGHWRLTVSYQGNVQSSASPCPPSNDPLLYDVQWRNKVQEGASGVLSILPCEAEPLDDVRNLNEPHFSETGSISVSVRPEIMRHPKTGYATLGQNLSGGFIKVHFDWIPDAFGIPAPDKAILTMKRAVSIAGKVYLAGSEQTATLNGSIIAGTILQTFPSTDVTGPTGSPPVIQDIGPFQNSDTQLTWEAVNIVGGTGDFTLPISWNMALAVDRKTGMMGQPPADAWAEVAATLTVHFAVANVGPSRFGGPGGGLDGNRTAQASDPTFTRWLPLSFSPQLSSQPFRLQSGALPAPWGNINCFYSMRMHQESDTQPNLDLNGFILLYAPNSAPPPPYLTLPGPLVPHKVITDANGDRLVFNSSNAPYEDIHSTFVPAQSKLQDSGPPGALKQVGNYTYGFQPVGGPGQVGYLNYITDGLNTQTLNWQGGTGPDVPYLVVTDSSSGRELRFYRGFDGYINKAVAPAENGLAFTRTELTWDGAGHVTAIRVYSGAGTTPLHTDLFTYNGDAIVQVSQGLSVSTAGFTFDSLLGGPFAGTTARVSSLTLGDTMDQSPSSDDANKPVHGIWYYNWGHLLGYNHWGEDIYKQSVTDPANNIWTTQMFLAQGNWGSITGTSSVGPVYTGASSANRTDVAFAPSYADPETVTIYDPLYFAYPTEFSPWILQHNTQGNLTSFKDNRGREWTWEYDGNGRNVLEAADPTNVAWTFGWGEEGSPASRLTSITDPAGLKRVKIDYRTPADPFLSFGQPTRLIIPANASASAQEEITTLDYGLNNGRGDLLSITDPLGDVFTIGDYDALGDPGSVSVYPTLGVPTTDPTKKLTASIVWDAAQRMQLGTLANGVQLVPTYSNGVLTQMQVNSPLGASLGGMELSYDTRGRVYKVEDTTGVLARFRYDQRGNLTRIYDGRSDGTLNSTFKTRFEYGANGELTRAWWPSGANMQVEYDAAGRVKWYRDERGYEFDVFTTYHAPTNGDKVRVRLRANATYGTLEEEVESIYDAAGRLEFVTDKRNGVITCTRDYVYTGALKRLTSVVTVIAALPAWSNTFTVSYTYKNDGSVATTTSICGTTTFAYDKAGQVTSLTDPWGDVTSWGYDHSGRLKSEQTTTYLGATLATTFGWGVSGIAGDPSVAPVYLRTLNEKINGQEFWNSTFTRSYLGKITGITGTGGGANQTHSATFGYDNRGRLSSESQSVNLNGSSTSNVAGSYTFDLANNLNANSGWGYNADGKLTGPVSGVGSLAGITGTVSYDLSGNLTAFNNQTLTYDGWGNLKSLTGPNGNISYTYDGSGRMLSRTTGGITTYFLYDGGTLIAEVDSDGYLLTGFVFGVNGLISHHTTTLEVDEFSFNNQLFAGEGGGEPQWNSRYYLYDGTGNTRGVTDAGGGVVAKASYGAFGAPLQQSGEPIRFGQGGQGGRYQEGNTGLSLSIRQRPVGYVPGSGQYTQPAGIGYSAGHPYSTTDLINEDDISVDEQGKPFAYGQVQRGLNGLGKGMETTLNIAASFNPLVSAGTLITGRDASGRTIGRGERMLGLIDLLPGGSSRHAVEAGVSVVAFGAIIANRADDVNELRRFHVVYKFIDNTGETVYVGKANEIARTPEGAVWRRIGKGHTKWRPDEGDTFEIIDEFSSRDASAGGEDVWYEYYRWQQANLRNDIPPMSYRKSRLEKTQRKLDAYNEELQRRRRQ